MQFRFVILGLLLAVAVIAGLNYGPQWFGQNEAPTAEPVAASGAPAAVVTAPQPAQPTLPLELGDESTAPPPTRDEAEPQAPLPTLNASDAWLRATIATSQPAPWEDESELLRSFAAVLDNAPRGTYPRNLLGFLAPNGPFKVLRSGSQIRLDPLSYDRYNRYVSALSDLSPAAMAQLFVRLDPLLRDALAELGAADAQPQALAAAAIAHVQATPILTEPPLLKQPKVIFKFADPALERLSPLQKQLLRMGPANLGVVKRWLAEFANHLR